MQDPRRRPTTEPPTPEAPIGPFGAVARSSEHPDVLVLAGEIDVAVAQEALAEVPGWAGVRTADMSEVTFLDSAGMRLVVRLARLVRPHRLRVVGATGQALDTLHHFGADQLVDLVGPDATAPPAPSPSPAPSPAP